MTEPATRLAERWREEAEVLRRRSAVGNAEVLESCADELEAALHGWALEPLTLDGAEEESGYSKSRLRGLVREGVIEDVGHGGQVMVRRGDLPRKPGRLAQKAKLDATVRQLRAS
jgi:hypothetical protein